MYNAFRLLLRCLGGVVLVMVAYAMAGLVGSLWTGPTVSLPQDGNVRVGLVRGPIHYDFLLPATDETRRVLDFAEKAGVPINHPNVAYILAGWGSHRFYTVTGTYRDLKPSTVWTAATGDQSVLRIDVLGPVDPDHVSWVTLSDAGYSALLDFISDTRAGELVTGGFTDTDVFFEANGAFDIFRTCNTWIGRGLRQAGHPFGRWTPTTFAVQFSLWWNSPRTIAANA